MSARYRIADEPRRSGLSHLVVAPFWPLLGFMFGGYWLALPWFAFNSIAIGNPRRRRDLIIALVGLAGAVGLVAGLFAAVAAGVLQGRLQVRLAFLALIAWKLSVCYLLYDRQATGFALYTYYGGIVRNGALVVGLGWFVGRRLLAQLDLPQFVDLVVS